MSKRKCLNIHDKLKVLESIDKCCKNKDVAEKFGIPLSSLSTVIKNRDLILKSSDNAGRETKRVKMCVFEDVDQAVLKWVINLRECISELAKVWAHEVRESTIQHCFSKAGFCEVAVNWDREDELPLSEVRNFWRCLETSGNIDSNITLADYFGVDEHIVTTGYPSDDDILKSVTSNSEIAADDDDEEDDSDEPVRKPTNEDMIKAFQTIRHGLQYLEDVPENIFNALNKCETYYEEKTYFNHRQESNASHQGHCDLPDLVLKQPPNDCQPFEEKSEEFIVAANIG
ncbi:hypothetical protein QE152_g1736 [Popillia japonica]|uniref:Uncharacterized protein n=1 Tax=Popillia japonica TaxID=7064 RepID=A0AAW1N1L0_POPJA